MAKHLHKLLRLFLSFLPQTRNESSQRKGKKIFIFLKQSQFERNFAIEKLVRTIKLIEYHLEDLGFRLDMGEAQILTFFFSKLIIPKNSISLRG